MRILVCTGPNEAFVIEEIGNGKIEVDFNNRVDKVGPEDWYVIAKTHLAYNELDRGNNYDLIISLNVPDVMVDGHIVGVWCGVDKINSKSLFTHLQELEETRAFLELGDNRIAIAVKDDKFFWCIVEEPNEDFESWFNIPEDVYKSLFKEVQRRDFDGDEVNTYPCGMVGYRDPFVGGFKRDELQCIVAASNSEGISRLDRLENFGGIDMNIYAHKLTPEECLERGMNPYNPNRDFEGDSLSFELPIAPKDCNDE